MPLQVFNLPLPCLSQTCWQFCLLLHHTGLQVYYQSHQYKGLKMENKYHWCLLHADQYVGIFTFSIEVDQSAFSVPMVRDANMTLDNIHSQKSKA